MDRETEVKLAWAATVGVECSNCADHRGMDGGGTTICGNEHPARYKIPLPRGVCPRCNGWGFCHYETATRFNTQSFSDPFPIFYEPYICTELSERDFQPVMDRGAETTEFVRHHFL